MTLLFSVQHAVGDKKTINISLELAVEYYIVSNPKKSAWMIFE